MEEILVTITDLLRQYGYKDEANLAEWLGQKSTEDIPATCQLLNNPDWWGETESIAAIDLALDGGFSPQARADGRHFRQMLIRLYDIMKSHGETNPLGEMVTMQFNKWLTSHM